MLIFNNSFTFFLLPHSFSVLTPSGIGLCPVSSDFLDVSLLPKAEYHTEQSKRFYSFSLKPGPHINNCYHLYSLPFSVLCQGVEIWLKSANGLMSPEHSARVVSWCWPFPWPLHLFSRNGLKELFKGCARREAINMKYVDQCLYYLLVCVTQAMRAWTFVTRRGWLDGSIFPPPLWITKASFPKGELGKRSWKNWDSHRLDPDSHSGSFLNSVQGYLIPERWHEEVKRGPRRKK